MDIKNEILWRIYAVLFVLIFVAAGIFIRAVRIQIVEGEYWEKKKRAVHVAMRPVNAERGSIMAMDGSYLATSLPYYEIRMDTRADGMEDKVFEENVDSLAACLMPWVSNRYPTKADFSYALKEARINNRRYFEIAKNVTYPDLQKIKDFPLFKLGPYGGGFIVIRQSKRQRPFGMLAHRTIGYIRQDKKSLGLESFYNNFLKGEEGKQVMQRVAGGYWIPLEDMAGIEPKQGDDIVTTLDIDIQDVAGNALLKALKRHDATHGCAIVMDVKTGAVRAMANIGRTSENAYWEDFNYAIGECTEPGSTFKLATIMALMEDGLTDLNDTIFINKGKFTFYENEMVDASFHGLDSTNIKQAFEISSNVGLAKLAFERYELKNKGEKATRNRQMFIDKLKQFHLDKKTGIDLEGEIAPNIKSPKMSSDWSGTTIPWMAIGYEIELTPLQLLTFYNTVANNGKMMKPYLVQSVQRFGKTVKTFPPTVIDEQIAKETTIQQAKELLKGVVANGTAQNINTSSYEIAGKTGTAQRNYFRINSSKNMQYQASFAGFFPADNPVYSCIVVIVNPKEGSFYGSQVAAPVFKEIADRCYVKEIASHPVLNEEKKPELKFRALPTYGVGYKKDFTTVVHFLKIPYQPDAKTKEWTVMDVDSSSVIFRPLTKNRTTMPNVLDMGVRDALFILENMGLDVEIRGAGRVKKQSVPQGRAIRRNMRVILTLGV